MAEYNNQNGQQYQQQYYQQQGGGQYQQPYNRPFDPKSQIPPEYQPIGMWGYFGYQLLFAIPIVGFICLIVFSVGGTRNVNLKNFARSYFCIYIIAAILLILLYLGGVAYGL